MRYTGFFPCSQLRSSLLSARLNKGSRGDSSSLKSLALCTSPI
ncbi:hypothetical protein [Moorena sp. SIOASIH]|nr:hypothetical protein [Moorena sp. SIOASIH]